MEERRKKEDELFRPDITDFVDWALRTITYLPTDASNDCYGCIYILYNNIYILAGRTGLLWLQIIIIMWWVAGRSVVLKWEREHVLPLQFSLEFLSPNPQFILPTDSDADDVQTGAEKKVDGRPSNISPTVQPIRFAGRFGDQSLADCTGLRWYRLTEKSKEKNASFMGRLIH